MCNCFLRKSNDKVCQDARTNLQNLIKTRNYDEISNQQLDLYSRKPEDDEEIDEDEIQLPKTKKTIKSESKFSQEFNKIYEEVERMCELEDEQYEPNKLFVPFFIFIFIVF
jgi:hypothetical protein